MITSPKSGWVEGFTIIEVMIVLAITGLMFLIAAIAISGKTENTEFNLSVNNIQTVIQQNINNVENGYFPNNNSYDCDGSANSAQPVIKSGTGVFKDCIFMGDVFQFGVGSTTSSEFNVYSIVGDQTWGNGPYPNPVQDLAETLPVLLVSAPGWVPSGISNLPITNDYIEYGLKLACGTDSIVYYNSTNDTTSPCTSTTGQHIGAFGFAVNTPNSINLATNEDTSTPVTVDLVVFPGTAPGQTQTQVADQVDSELQGPPNSYYTDPAGGVYICLGGNSNSSTELVTIGAHGDHLNVTTVIKGPNNCT